MSRTNPLRRLAASTAVLGLTAFGGIALASPALASPALASPALAAPGGADGGDVAAVGEVVLPSLDPMTVGDLMGSLKKADTMTIQSPTPDGPVVIDIARFRLTYAPDAAETAQTVIANFYGDLGYQVAFSKKHVLVIGEKICDPTKSAAWNTGCVDPSTTNRF